jgi:hypothetical protein
VAWSALWTAPALPPAHAGGPVVVSLGGRIGKWPSGQAIGYRVDPGTLGRFGHDAPAQWVGDAFRQWQELEDARFQIEDRGALATDINQKNALAFLQDLPPGVASVIFDTDGRALDQLIGQGGGTGIAGITGFSFTDDLVRNGRIGAAWIILSGRSLATYRPEFVRGIILHEVGHALGLHHSQINAADVWDGIPENGELGPRMSYYWGPNTPPHLARDDRAWMASLYPTERFTAVTGTIRGRVLLSDGVTPVQGLNVIARRIGDDEITAISAVSGDRFKSELGLGARDPLLWGVYEIPGLPPGSYRVSVEPLLPHPIMAPRTATFPGARRSWHQNPGDDPTTATPIVVEAGQIVSGKDILLPGAVPAPAAVEETEPNEDAEGAQSVPRQAVISGRADPAATGSLPQSLPDGRSDAVQDWYRLTLEEPTFVTAMLTAREATADLNLYLIGPSATSSERVALARSIDPGTPPETVQTWLPPGDYFLGVSAPNASSPASDYTLRVTTVAAPEETAAPGPAIQALLVGDITDTSARVTWRTDQPANSTVLIGPNAPYPYLTSEFGSPELTREHSIPVTGLARGALYFLCANSRNAEGILAAPAILSHIFLPPLPLGIFTAAGSPSADPPRLAVALIATQADPARPDEQLVLLQVRNTAGPAADVRLEEVTPADGWSLAGAPDGPFSLGALGSRAAAMALFRLRPTSDAPGAAGLRLRGSYALPDGSRKTFGL